MSLIPEQMSTNEKKNFDLEMSQLFQHLIPSK